MDLGKLRSGKKCKGYLTCRCVCGSAQVQQQPSFWQPGFHVSLVLLIPCPPLIPADPSAQASPPGAPWGRGFFSPAAGSGFFPCFNKPGVCQLPNGKGMLCVATAMDPIQRQGTWPVPFSGVVVGKWVSPRDAQRQSPRSERAGGSDLNTCSWKTELCHSWQLAVRKH